MSPAASAQGALPQTVAELTPHASKSSLRSAAPGERPHHLPPPDMPHPLPCTLLLSFSFLVSHTVSFICFSYYFPTLPAWL